MFALKFYVFSKLGDRIEMQEAVFSFKLIFNQVDMRGNLFGMLSAHPLSPLVSLHHFDAVDPLYPNMSRTQALEHLFKAVNVDPARILQQIVCYDRTNSLTVSVAWGYSIQVFEGNKLLPDLLSLQRTFLPWRRGAKSDPRYMFNMREYPRDPCKRPSVYFMESVASGENGIWSYYTRHDVGDCPRANATKNLDHIRVSSHKLEPDTEQVLLFWFGYPWFKIRSYQFSHVMFHIFKLFELLLPYAFIFNLFQLKASRRQCCDISPMFNESMVIGIRQCGSDELISMDL